MRGPLQTAVLQEVRITRFEDIYGRFQKDRLSYEEASDVLGVSASTFRRYRRRYDAQGTEGHYDRRLGRVSARRAATDEVMKELEPFETRYFDFTSRVTNLPTHSAGIGGR